MRYFSDPGYVLSKKIQIKIRFKEKNLRFPSFKSAALNSSVANLSWERVADHVTIQDD